MKRAALISILLIAAIPATGRTDSLAGPGPVVLVAHLFCEKTTPGGDICNLYKDHDELEKTINYFVATVNTIYRHTGYSFVPEIKLELGSGLEVFSGLNYTESGKPWDQTDVFFKITIPITNDRRVHWVATSAFWGSSFSGRESPAAFTPLPSVGDEVYRARVLAHELGHFFGLDHTFSWADGPNANYDGDAWSFQNLYDIADCTEPDKGAVEYTVDRRMCANLSECPAGMAWCFGNVCSDCRFDADCPMETPVCVQGTCYDANMDLHPDFYSATALLNLHNLLKDHAYCQEGDFIVRPDGTMYYTDASYSPSDPGSYNPTYPNNPRCVTTPGKPPKPASDELIANMMSYYNPSTGPWIRAGKLVLPFQACQEQVIQRKAKDRELENACPGSKDADQDGICDDVDPCVNMRHDSGTWGLISDHSDADGDGLWAECDACEKDPNPNPTDIDGDGIPDSCDDDRDNDGCKNDIDKDPDNPLVVSGYVLCRGQKYATYTWGGVSHDDDSLLSCSILELDNDNDGIKNSEDPCPLSKNPTCMIDVPGSCYAHFEHCGRACQRWRLIVSDRINWPISINEVISQYTDLVAFAPPVGHPASIFARELYEYIRGYKADEIDVPGFAPLMSRAVTIRLEDDQGKESFEIEIDSNQVILDMSQRGNLIEMRLPAFPGEVLWMGPVPTPGTIDSIAPDIDGDLVADVVDNCVCARNPGQDDRDHDGVGNACDPDFNNDGIVDAAEVADVANCVDMVTPPRDLDGNGGSGPSRCVAFDFDLDGFVSYERDFKLAYGMLGSSPGPSSVNGSWSGLCPQP